MRDLKLVYESTRPWSLKISYATIASAVAYAIYSLGKVEPVLLLLLAIAFFGVLALHVMVNWLNDYFDYFKGTDTKTSGSVVYRVHPIISDVFKPHELLIASLSLGAFAIIMGLSLVFLFDRPLVLLFGFAGMFLALFYNAPPFALKYRALGEPATFMGFFLMFIGTYYVMTGSVTWESVVLALPPGLLTASVLSTNNIRDIENDRKAGFKTLAVLLGRKGMATLIVVMISVTFVSVLGMIVLGELPLLSLLAFVTLPTAVGVIRDVYNEYISLKAEGGAEDAPVRVSKVEVQMLYILAITLVATLVLRPILAGLGISI